MAFMNKESFEQLKDAMLECADRGDLPQCITLTGAEPARIKDLVETIDQFQREAGLNMSISLQVENGELFAIAIVNFLEPLGDVQ